ncbi:pyrrolidone-carboxylate peptidase [Heyndrickxia shackletonii]|uniref:Pyrrolidone-carboxylate peptidase n=1 Tax=Heyndrickxia shackletonii TaxID=157838 RepID=A0A0Q3WXL4_9BACI|nr:pyroglutamyl-peptidase I [Heyndrickxia shackletonii]KQL54261.1 pyrrolidone-carboxylate peptidase [Heyndrickxia shackletonii]NEZ00949.1 pyroglutamyl-peptidase I [Heyndrickxia shackletonii]
MGKKVLITGFDPFGKDVVNPALEAVKKLEGRKIDDVEIVTQEVPTVFHESIKVVTQAIEANQPDVVICVGQAGGRTQITPERVAINIDDARIPDNRNNQPIDEQIVEDGPAAYWSTLPVKRIVHHMREAGIPAAVSNSAGTFVCNHLFYGLMNYLEKNAPHIRGGFIHIPFIPEQTVHNNAPSLGLDTIVKALELAAVVAANEKEDIREIGGTIS